MCNCDKYRIDPKEGKIGGVVSPGVALTAGLAYAVATGRMKQSTAWLILVLVYGIVFGIAWLAYDAAGMSMCFWR
jgi:hypothetical protein